MIDGRSSDTKHFPENPSAHPLNRLLDGWRKWFAMLESLPFDQQRRHLGRILLGQTPAREGKGLIPTEGMEADSGGGRQWLHVRVAEFDERPWGIPGATGIDNDHVRHGAHPQGDVDPRCGGVNAAHAVGEPAGREASHDFRAKRIVSPEEIPTAKDKSPHASPHPARQVDRGIRHTGPFAMPPRPV